MGLARLVQWTEREHHLSDRSSPSVKNMDTAHKGMTRGKRSRESSVTLWWIPKDFPMHWLSLPRTSRIAQESWWALHSIGKVCRKWSTRWRMAATQAAFCECVRKSWYIGGTSPNVMNCIRSLCCQNAGLWSAPSPGSKSVAGFGRIAREN